MRARHLYPQGACSLEGGDRTQTPKGMASQGRVANAVFGGEAQEPRGPTGGGGRGSPARRLGRLLGFNQEVHRCLLTASLVPGPMRGKGWGYSGGKQ